MRGIEKNEFPKESFTINKFKIQNFFVKKKAKLIKGLQTKKKIIIKIAQSAELTK